MSSSPDEVRAVLFDMDGVLVSSDGISRLAARDTLKQLYGITVDPDEFLAYTGMGEGVFLSSVAAAHGVEIDQIAKTKDLFFDIYLRDYCNGSVNISFPGAASLVQACKEKGMSVAVASAADYVKVEANLKAGAIDIGMFDAVVSADAFEGKLKPNPDIFLAASKALGVDPRHCVVIEDAVSGVEAGQRAGMRVIGVTTTLTPEVLCAGEYVPDVLKGEIGDISLDDILTVGMET